MSDDINPAVNCPCGKKGYKLRSDAKDVVWAARRKSPRLAFSEYRCPVTGLWHVGHDRKFRTANVQKTKKKMRKHIHPK